LDVFLLPLLPAVLRAAATCDQTTLVNDHAFECHRYLIIFMSILPHRWSTRTFDLLDLVVTDILHDLHCVAHKHIPTCMVYRPLHSGFVLDHVDREMRALGKCTKFVIDRLHLDSAEQNEGCLASALVAHIL